jgi:hypothetical protein
MATLPDRVANAGSAVSGTVAIMGIHQLRRSLDLADIGFQVEGIEQRSLLKAHQLDLIAIGEKGMDARAGDLRKLARRRARGLFARS